MPQTILALAAILTFSIYMLSRHGAEAEAERFGLTAEMEFAATDIATERLAAVLSHAFDEADLGREGVRSDTDGLSAIGSTDADELSEAAFDDVDDFHTVTRSVPRSWYGTDLVFTDSVSVRYVRTTDPDGVLSASERTLAKEVIVTVTTAPIGYVGQPEISAQLRQVVTSASQAPYRN